MNILSAAAKQEERLELAMNSKTKDKEDSLCDGSTVTRNNESDLSKADALQDKKALAKSESGLTTSSQFISVLSEHDVLLGRGTGPNEARGNIKFRSYVRKAIQSMNLNELDGKRKARIAKEIFDLVKSNNGRFVKVAPTSSSGPNGSRRTYVFVPDAVALDKIKQSFRHQIRVLVESNSAIECKPATPDSSRCDSISSNGRPVAGDGTGSGLTADAALLRARELLPSRIAHPPPPSNVWNLYGQGLAAGGYGWINPNHLLMDDALTRELKLSQLRSSPAAFSGTSLEDPLVTVARALASVEAEATIRRISSAALQVPAAVPPTLAALLKNGAGAGLFAAGAPAHPHLQDSALRSLPMSDLCLLGARLAMEQPLSVPTAPVTSSASPTNLSVLGLLLNSHAGNAQ